MATTGRSADATDAPEEVSRRCREADVVHLLGRADGDGLAAVGLLGRALDAIETPYQVSLVRTPLEAEDRLLDGGTVLGVGLPGVGDVTLGTDSLAFGAYDVATRIDADPDPILALAGASAGGITPTGPVLEDAADRGIERRPGVGLPTADLATGLAFSGRLHARFSGDEHAAGALLADLELPAEMDESAHTRLASAVAVEATDSVNPDRSAEALGTILRPYETPGPFETVEGYADVLEALATGAPGIGVAYLLGYEERESVISAWTSAGGVLHRDIANLSLSSTGDVTAGWSEDADPARVARLVRDFRAAEPTVAIAGPSSLGLATVDLDARSLLASAFEERAVSGSDSLAVLAPIDERNSVSEPERLAERLKEAR